MSEAGAVAVHCPTSNLFLGSGLFPLKAFARREKPVRIGVATDIGGGSSYSMLRTMDEAYKIQQLLGERLNPLDSYYHMTLGNAEALSLADRIGTLDPGTDADLVVLDAAATPAMALKMEVVKTLPEELFLLQTMGDDRAVAETYVAGKAVKTALWILTRHWDSVSRFTTPAAPPHPSSPARAGRRARSRLHRGLRAQSR